MLSVLSMMPRSPRKSVHYRHVVEIETWFGHVKNRTVKKVVGS